MGAEDDIHSEFPAKAHSKFFCRPTQDAIIKNCQKYSSLGSLQKCRPTICLTLQLLCARNEKHAYTRTYIHRCPLLSNSTPRRAVPAWLGRGKLCP